MKKVVDSGNLTVSYAPYTYFLDLIEKKQQFNYSRVQHGVSDVLIETYNNEAELIKDIQLQEWDKIAKKVIDNNHGVLKFWHQTNNDITDKFATAYRVIYENDSLVPNIHLGVSTGVGFGKNGYGNLPEKHPMQQKRTLITKVLTETATNLYHGGLPRHMSIMGEVHDFFTRLNQMEVDVVIYGPVYMKTYFDVFKINRFHHLPISAKGAIGEVDKIIPHLIDYCTKLKNPLILNCSGHIISQLLAYELRNTTISNFDIGLGFNWYIKDYLKQNHPEINIPWIKQPEHMLRRYINDIR